jgi:hypothetical protein
MNLHRREKITTCSYYHLNATMSAASCRLLVKTALKPLAPMTNSQIESVPRTVQHKILGCLRQHCVTDLSACFVHFVGLMDMRQEQSELGFNKA